MRGNWEPLERPAPEAVRVGTTDVRRGSRVRLRPRRGADVFDLALAERAAIVEEIVAAVDGTIQLAVTVEDDPGRDLGAARQLGHRFFFTPDEVEPLAGSAAPTPPWLLVAGIGNVFLADDGFGVAVAERLQSRDLGTGVHVEDYGIRGLDLAYALADFETVVLVDSIPRGDTPGTLYVIDAEVDAGDTGAPEAHGMDPVQVLSLAKSLTGELPRVLVVGCEPALRMTGTEEEVVAELSEPVRNAVDGAVELVETLVADLAKQRNEERMVS